MAGILLLALVATQARGASQSIVVTMTVTSSTEIDGSGCTTGSSAASLGSVLPATPTATATDCTVLFGSTNDSSQLRMSQQDGWNRAMYGDPVATRDLAFGSGSHFTHAPGGNQELQGVAPGPDGVIYAAGWSATSGSNEGVVYRLTPAGALDPGFAGGRIETSLGGGNDQWRDVLVPSEGGVVVVGFEDTGDRRWRLQRYLDDGTLDASFGTGGVTTLDLGADHEMALAATFDGQGRIVVAGSTGATSATDDLMVARFTADGQLDTTFAGGAGYVVHALSGNDDDLFDVLVDDAGRIVVAGERYVDATQLEDGFVARLDPTSGAFDGSFGAAGITTIAGSTANDTLRGISIDADGDILAAGDIGGDMMVARLDGGTGALDATFGTGGIATFDNGGNDDAVAVEQAPGGGYFAMGTTDVGGDDDDLTLLLTSNGQVDDAYSPSAFYDGAGGTITDGMLGPDGRPLLTGRNGTGQVLVSRFEARSIGNYVGGATDFDQGDDAFGACLRTVAGGATAGASWTPDGDCSPSDGPDWREVPASDGAAGAVLASNATVPSSTANEVRLRFGARVAAGEAAGRFVAPIAFQVVAPSV